MASQEFENLERRVRVLEEKMALHWEKNVRYEVARLVDEANNRNPLS